MWNSGANLDGRMFVWSVQRTLEEASEVMRHTKHAARLQGGENVTHYKTLDLY